MGPSPLSSRSTPRLHLGAPQFPNLSSSTSRIRASRQTTIKASTSTPHLFPQSTLPASQLSSDKSAPALRPAKDCPDKAVATIIMVKEVSQTDSKSHSSSSSSSSASSFSSLINAAMQMVTKASSSTPHLLSQSDLLTSQQPQRARVHSELSGDESALANDYLDNAVATLITVKEVSLTSDYIKVDGASTGAPRTPTTSSHSELRSSVFHSTRSLAARKPVTDSTERTASQEGLMSLAQEGALHSSSPRLTGMGPSSLSSHSSPRLHLGAPQSPDRSSTSASRIRTPRQTTIKASPLASSSTVLLFPQSGLLTSQQQKRAGALGKLSSDKPAPPLLANNSSDKVVLEDAHLKTEAELQCSSSKVVEHLLPRDKEARTNMQQVLASWKNTGILSEIESHAMAVPASATGSISELAASLATPHARYLVSVGAAELHQQLAKAYAIFFWVATNISYDTELLCQFLTSSDGKIDCRAGQTLQRRKSLCMGYANLFEALAGAVQLEAVVVHGHIKSWRVFADGGAIDGTFQPLRANGHSWNMVKIGVWFPVDCTHGSGTLVQQDQLRCFCRDYFASSPKHLVFTHIPTDPSWQLLQKPLILDELRPLIAPDIHVFGRDGVEPQVWRECIHIAPGSPDPVARVSIHAQPDVHFSAELDKASREQAALASTHSLLDSSSSLDRNIFIQQTEKGVCVFAAMPRPGHYTLKVYSNRKNDNRQEGQQTLSLCLTHVLQCDATTQAQVGYPSVYLQAAESFAFRLLHWGRPQKAYICECKTGRLSMQMAFRALSDLEFFHCLLPGRVDKPAAVANSAGQHHRTVVIRDTADPTLYSLHVVFPEKGWWTVYLSVSYPDDSGCSPLLSYSVLASQGLPSWYYPHALSHLVSFSSAEPISATGSEVVSLPFSAPVQLAFLSHLTHWEPKGDKVKHCTLVSKEGMVANTHLYCLKVVFPCEGLWYVHVYAINKADLTPTFRTFSSLFTLCIEVTQGQMGRFPSLDSSAEDLGIALLDHKPVSYTNNDLPFHFQFLAHRHTDFLQPIKLVSCDNDSADDLFLENCTSLSQSPIGDPCLYTVTAILPHVGSWKLKVSAQQPGTNQYPQVFSVPLKVYVGVTHLKRFFNLYPAFHQLGLGLCEEHQQYTTTVAGSEFILPFLSPDGLCFDSSLKSLPAGEKVQHDIIVLHTSEHGKANKLLRVLFPCPGAWLVRLFACPWGKGCDSLSLVLEVRLKAEGFRSKHTFPQVFDAFDNEFGLELDSAALPLVSRVHTIPHTLTIPFVSPDNVRFWHDAVVTSDPGIDTYATRITSDQLKIHHELVTKVSSWGEWKITLYAQHSLSDGHNFTPVLHHMITAEQPS